ncbi:MAG: hypothetical protein L0387_35560 [Acidobacteria bacterium]|nr:hypothetical protein [Acidobacteriota bacterium]MCI0723615.1 hypothetical protein [Acidobacteriota bacterium]
MACKKETAHRVSPESGRLEALWVGVDRFNAGLREQKRLWIIPNTAST